MKIFIEESTLTDGSKVYAVRLTRFEDMSRSIDTLVFDAVSKEDAEALSAKLCLAINAHTNEVTTEC